MGTVRISGNWRTVTKLEWAGTPEVDTEGHIERSIAIPEEAFAAIERHLVNGVKEGTLYLKDGRRFDWLLDGPLPVKPAKAAAAASKFVAVDAGQLPWEEHLHEKIGKALLCKELLSDPKTGMQVRLLRYPAGIINPSHTHPCGHGMYVLEGQLVTHKGIFGPGSFVWFPAGEAMEHGASAAGDVTVLFITNTVKI